MRAPARDFPGVLSPQPWKVRDLDDYLDYVAETLDYAGAYLVDPPWLYHERYVVDLEESPLYGATISQEALFHDGSRLHFMMSVSPEVDVDVYGYHYMQPDGGLIARLCKKPGHEYLGGACGGLCHMHLIESGQEIERASEEFAFDDAISFLRADEQTPQ